MPPIVAIVGRSKSGKTTLVEKLITELGSRGYRTATVKHTHGGMSFDKPGKDTWRYLEAGSVAAVASSGDRLVLISPEVPKTLDGMARILGEDCDLILAEGFKQGDAPKMEVHRREVGPLLSGIKKLVAVVTDEPVNKSRGNAGRRILVSGLRPDGSVSVSVSYDSPYELRIVRADGRIAVSIQSASPGQYHFSRQELAPGAYLVDVACGSQRASATLLQF